jgi:tRNA-binding EMAP/Myf-like protein
VKVDHHPNADALKVYNFSHGEETLQIVANLENIYNIGDVAIIIKAGSVMKDGTKIKTASMRGVRSSGMAIGKTDVPAGTDLSEEYCQEEMLVHGVRLIPWPDIESLYNIRKYLVQNNTARTVAYRAKVKIDGCCAGIQLPPSNSNDQRVIPQSRNRILNPDQDNMNFAKWVVARYDFFMQVRERADKLGIKDHLTIFGEFSGLGIQKRTSISTIDRTILAIFAIQIGREAAKFETDPETISSIIFPEALEDNKDVFVLPWHGNDIELSYDNPEKLQDQAEVINEIVNDVEKCDPWVKDTFGIEGLGEGVVMYPIIDGKTLIDRMDYTDLVFKAKGEKHKVVNAKKPAQINPEFVATINDFVNLMVTENRLEQVAQKVGEYHKKNTGSFLKEFSQDVHKESKAELEDADLDWKQVSKAVGDKARKWWMNKCNQP